MDNTGKNSGPIEVKSGLNTDFKISVLTAITVSL